MLSLLRSDPVEPFVVLPAALLLGLDDDEPGSGDPGAVVGGGEASKICGMSPAGTMLSLLRSDPVEPFVVLLRADKCSRAGTPSPPDHVHQGTLAVLAGRVATRLG
jgi:hypothetical protein